MDIQIKNIPEEQCGCEALIIPLLEGGTGLPGGLSRDTARFISQAIGKRFSGKPNEVMLVHAPGRVKPERFLFVGLGAGKEVTDERVRQAGGKAVSVLREQGLTSLAASTALLTNLGRSPVSFAEGALLAHYSYQRFKKPSPQKPIRKLTLLAKPSPGLSKEVAGASAVSAAVHFTRDLVNAPANDMTPEGLAQAARSLRSRTLSVKVIDAKAAKKAGMGSYLAVASGSAQPPRFIVLEYRGASRTPIVLIGKSVTFDSGGLSLKPSDGMEKMKYDMAGGAAVLGVLKAAAALRLKDRIIGILPATENLPGGSATRPGDVVRAINGTTIEIVNTDAEGRLTLADAIGYAKRFRPRAVVDIATLTGACAIAFGGEAVAMMGNDRKILDALKTAGEKTYERVWEMPLFDEYKEYLKSDIADLKNIGGRIGGLMTSGSFLKEFAGQTPWVHLDIAGTAWVEKERPYTPKGASGIGVRLILESLKEIA